MTNIVVNGDFLAGLTSWYISSSSVTRNADGNRDIGSAEIDSVAAISNLYQTVTAPGCTAGENQLVRLRYAMKQAGGNATKPLTVQVLDASLNVYYSASHVPAAYVTDKWLEVNATFNVPATVAIKIQIGVAKDTTGFKWRVDNVSLEEADIASGSCEDLTLELRKRRADLGAIKHPLARYKDAVNQAIRECPRSMWQETWDESVVTVDDVRKYDLSALSGLTESRQVSGVWMETEAVDGRFLPIATWRVEDAGTFCYLVLDDDPPEGRKLRIRYLLAPAELDCDDRANVTIVDRDWLLAAAMTTLLMEADPTREDANWLAQQLSIWDAKRRAREAQVMHRRTDEVYGRTNWSRRR